MARIFRSVSLYRLSHLNDGTLETAREESIRFVDLESGIHVLQMRPKQHDQADLARKHLHNFLRVSQPQEVFGFPAVTC